MFSRIISSGQCLGLDPARELHPWLEGIRLTLQSLAAAVDRAVSFRAAKRRPSSVPAGEIRSKDKDLHQKSSSSSSSSSSKSDSSSMWTLYWADGFQCVLVVEVVLVADFFHQIGIAQVWIYVKQVIEEVKQFFGVNANDCISLCDHGYTSRCDLM